MKAAGLSIFFLFFIISAETLLSKLATLIRIKRAKYRKPESNKPKPASRIILKLSARNERAKKDYFGYQERELKKWHQSRQLEKFVKEHLERAKEIHFNLTNAKKLNEFTAAETAFDKIMIRFQIRGR